MPFILDLSLLPPSLPPSLSLCFREEAEDEDHISCDEEEHVLKEGVAWLGVALCRLTMANDFTHHRKAEEKSFEEKRKLSRRECHRLKNGTKNLMMVFGMIDFLQIKFTTSHRVQLTPLALLYTSPKYKYSKNQVRRSSNTLSCHVHSQYLPHFLTYIATLLCPK